MIHIYGSYKCFYCRLSKELCKSYGLKYNFFDINKIQYKVKVNNLRQKGIIPEKYNSIPIIIINNKFIGGFSQLEKILENRSLVLKLKKSKKRKSIKK